SMTVPPVASLRAGRALRTLTVPDTVKTTVSEGSAAEFTWALASRIAWRSVPAPLSARELTVKTAGARRSSSSSGRGQGRKAVGLVARRRAARRCRQVASQFDRILIGAALPGLQEADGHQNCSSRLGGI